MSNKTAEVIHQTTIERICVIYVCEVMKTRGMCWRGILAIYKYKQTFCVNCSYNNMTMTFASVKVDDVMNKLVLSSFLIF